MFENFDISKFREIFKIRIKMTIDLRVNLTLFEP